MAMADIIAVGVYIQYWFDIPQWIPAIICLIILLGFNLLTVKLFGELEFWFSLNKSHHDSRLNCYWDYFTHDWFPNRYRKCYR